jgi:hypothetical protein
MLLRRISSDLLATHLLWFSNLAVAGNVSQGLSMYRALQLAAADPNVNQTAVVAVAAHSLLNTWCK